VTKPKLALGILIIILLTSFYAASTELRVHSASAYSSNTDTKNFATQLWNFAPVGTVYSSPIVGDGNIYFVTSFEWYPQGIVYCLNASTGTQIWNYTAIQGHAYSLAISEGYVYATSTYGNVYAFDASAGAKKWNYTTEDSVTSPIFGDGVVYVGSGRTIPRFGDIRGVKSNVLALDALTGEKIWNYTIERPKGFIFVDKGVIYVASAGGFGKSIDNEIYSTIYALETKTVTSPTLTIVVITGVVVIVVLAVVFLAYRARLKRAKGSPLA
jgi:outer membrane protein assembly factor BamB